MGGVSLHSLTVAHQKSDGPLSKHEPRTAVYLQSHKITALFRSYLHNGFPVDEDSQRHSVM
jgi:hypothetical protein